MSYHTQISDEVRSRLASQRRKTVISRFIIAQISSLSLLFLVFKVISEQHEIDELQIISTANKDSEPFI